MCQRPEARLNYQQSTDGLAFHCVPETDGTVSSSSHHLGTLSRPCNSPDLILAHHSSVEFGQLFSAWLVQVEDVDLSVLVAASEEVVAAGIEVQAANRTTFIIAESGEQFGLFGLGKEEGTWEMS